MRRIDIRTRIQLAAMIPMVLIAVTLTWYFMEKRWVDLEKAEHKRASTIAHLLAPVSEHALFANNPDDVLQLQQRINSLAKGVAEIAAIAVSNADGELVAVNGSFSKDDLSRAATQLDEKNIITAAVSVPLPVQHSSNELYQLDDPRFMARSPKLLGHVSVKIDRQRMEKEKRDFAFGACIFLLLGLAVSGCIAWYLGRGVSRPILALANIAAEIERGNLKARASIVTSGPLQVLGRAINQMAIALDNAHADMQKRIHDATAQLQAQKEVAEQANRTKTQIMAAISHDVRQPLQALGLSINSLTHRVTNPETEQIVQRIERSLSSLENVLNDIAQLDPVVQDFPITGLFDSLAVTFSGTAEEYGLRLHFVPTKAWCRSDRGLLERILANLVSNALRYTSAGGVVVGCRHRGASLQIEVWDSGCGIPVDKRSAIFREFARIGPTPSGRTKGRGLGLAIVDRLCKLLGHTVQCKSTRDTGSVFCVGVPRVEGVHLQIIKAIGHHDDRYWPGKQIVVIDDDQEVLASLRDTFEIRGAHVISRAALQEVLPYIDLNTPPVLLISDFHLDNGNGIEAVRAIRQVLEVAVPAVIISGDMRIALQQSLLDEGIPFLRKPVSIEALWDAIGLAMRGGPGNEEA